MSDEIEYFESQPGFFTLLKPTGYWKLVFSPSGEATMYIQHHYTANLPVYVSEDKIVLKKPDAYFKCGSDEH